MPAQQAQLTKSAHVNPVQQLRPVNMVESTAPPLPSKPPTSAAKPTVPQSMPAKAQPMVSVATSLATANMEAPTPAITPGSAPTTPTSKAPQATTPPQTLQQTPTTLQIPQPRNELLVDPPESPLSDDLAQLLTGLRLAAPLKNQVQLLLVELGIQTTDDAIFSVREQIITERLLTEHNVPRVPALKFIRELEKVRLIRDLFIPQLTF